MKPWKHQTAKHCGGHGDKVGVDLFDDEQRGHVTIYVRYADGTRFPARDVNLANIATAGIVIRAWMAEGLTNDYRGKLIENCNTADNVQNK